MKQIKPVVRHWVKARPSGGLAITCWKRCELRVASRVDAFVHPNGKVKFRPVYDYTVSHEVEKQDDI